MDKGTLAAGGLLIVGVGAVAAALVGPSLLTQGSSTQYLTSQAAVTNVVDEIAATGAIGATTYSLAFGTAPVSSTGSSTTGSSSAAAATAASTSASSGSSSSWTVQTVAVKAGDKVNAGQTLATADPSMAQLEVALAEANLTAAKAKLSTDQGNLSANDLAAAKLQVTQAQQQLSQARTSYSQTAAQNALKLKQAQAALTKAQTQVATDQAAGAPANVIAADESAVSQAQDNLASTKLQISQSNTQASNQIAAANLSLTSAQLAYSSKTSPNAQAVAADQVTVAQAEQSLANAKLTLQYATLASPVDGVVETVSVANGGTASGTAIVVRANTLQVAASVTESDLPNVKVGQQATVTITALSKDVTGTVTSVDQVGSSSGTGGVVSYGVDVALADTPTGVARGMSAEVSIITASADNVLAVPAIALQSSNGSYSVRVLDANGQPQTVAVQVGLVTSSYAEIKSGITEGTAVITGTASSRTSTTSSSTTTRGVGIPGLDGGGPGGFPQGRP